MNMAAMVNSPTPGVNQTDFDDRPIALILEDVERNIAVMGRAAKAYSDREIHRSERAECYDELHSLFEAFHQFISYQMGTLVALREGLERDIRLVTISDLRACSELKRPTLAEVARAAVQPVDRTSG